MIDKFLRGDEKLFQRLFSLPALIMITSVIVTTLILPQQIPTPSISSLSSLLTLTQSAFAYHGQEVILSLDNSTFTPLTTGTGNQIKVLANYKIQNSSIVGQTINAVMKLYTSNGTLIKTSSYPSGFVAQNTNGTVELKSTVEDPTIQSAIANITLTNASKTEVISNEISTTANLQGASLIPTTNTTAITPEEETDKQPSQVQEPPPPLQQPSSPQPSQQEGIQGEENIPQPAPSPEAEAPGIVPPFG
jgi:hypothetical protein